MRTKRFVGAEVAAVLPQLARLRIEVFREYPYLYDGDLDYERRYLAVYARSSDAFVAGYFSALGELVAAVTGVSMQEEDAALQAPLRARGFDPRRVYYLGELVMHRELHGQGLGSRLAAACIDHAHALKRFDWIACATVIRPSDDPLRPADFRPADAFIARMGFEKVQNLIAQLSWKEIGETDESSKPMQLWLSNLDGVRRRH